MSRKPPKLFPIEDKISPAPTSEKKVPECMPPLKQGAPVNSSSTSKSSSFTSSVVRRAGPARHFLNCNGSASKRRFTGSSSSSTSTIRSLLPPKANNEGSTNGCGNEETSETSAAIAVAPVNKVNGTISNGLSSTRSTDSTRPLKRSKSLAAEDSSVSSDSHQHESSSINGKNSECSNLSTSSRNPTNSQSNDNVKPATSFVTRTSRFRPSGIVSNVSNKATKSPCPSPNTTLPALVPFDDGAPTNSTIRHQPVHPSSEEVESTAISNDSEPSPEQDTAESNDQDQKESIIEGPISEEPKIIRKGDTVIKSYVDEKTGKIVVFEKGMNLEVCDFGSGQWYPAKVNNVDWHKQEILVHYSNWSSRYDEWISMTSTRIRPSKNTNVVTLQFIVGERVEAVWPADSKKYFGTITQTLSNDMYEVLFDDGIKKKRSVNQLFKVSQNQNPPSAQKKVEAREEPVKETATPSSRPMARRRSIKPDTPVRNTIKSSVPVTPTGNTEATPTLPSEPPSRPPHFSVFDLPKGDLGKRRRTVQDYSLLVKGQTRRSRRPKSEGGAGTSAPTTDDESTATPEQPEAAASEAAESTTPANSSSRRRKVGGPKEVPVSHSSPVEPSTPELPVSSAVAKEESDVLNESTDTPPKKQKQPSPPSASSILVSAVSSTPASTSSSKPEVVAVSATTLSEPTAPTPSSTSTTSSTPAAPPTSRRPRSSGSVLALVQSTPISLDVPKDTKVDSGFVDGEGNAIIIEQNENDGFWKCPLPNCGKNFRKDNLLKMHFKHYHPELKVTRGVANVVQMAQARTAFENYSNEHHASWPKSLTEQPSTRESSPVGKAAADANSTPEVLDTHSTQKKGSKSTPPLHSKDPSLDKVSSQGTQKLEDDHHHRSPSKSSVAEGVDDESPDSFKALNQSPRLRVNRKRNFVWTKHGIRVPRQWRNDFSSPSPRRKIRSPEKEGVIGTDYGSKKSKLSQSSFEGLQQSAADLEQSSSVDSPANSFSLSISNTPSPSVVSDQKSEFSIESGSGSSSNEPYLVPPLGEAEPFTSRGRSRGGRWSKSRIRSGLMSSNVRRVGSGMVYNSTSTLIKKRIGNYRKFIGKRSRQKTTSILSRISSGRMRVILEALNQRSLRKRRFLATRRGRDVKVDVINCICSNKTEFGLMIQCELCLCWQHGSCFNVQTNSQLPDYYACQSCSEPEKVRLSKKFEWAESEFYKLGKLPSFPFAPSFPKEDARIMKMCTNLTSDLAESFSMMQSLKVKERICFGNPEHPQLYQWNSERPPPQDEIQRDKFQKYFQPVLRRLLLENKSDPTYPQKLKKISEARLKLKKYSETVESARATMKKMLGCKAAAFLDHICDTVFDDMVRFRRKRQIEDTGGGLYGKKEGLEVKKRSAEQAYHRLLKVREEVARRQAAETRPHSSSYPGVFSSPTKGTSYVSNGLVKDIGANVKDFQLLRKYLKERRTLDTSITTVLQRMNKEFPDDWKNLMRSSREFVKTSSTAKKESGGRDREKVTWVTCVIITYNNLRILLRQIFSETNPQKQACFATEFEKATIRLFDLFGVKLTEKGGANVSPQKRPRRVKGLETLDLLQDITPNLNQLQLRLLADNLEKQREEVYVQVKATAEPTEVDDQAQKEEKLDAAIEATNMEEKRLNELTMFCAAESMQTTSYEVENQKDPLFRARGVDGKIAVDFIGTLGLHEVLQNLPDFPLSEETEENVDLNFPDEPTSTEDTSATGIIGVPAASKITPDVCRKNLVRDIIMQQQQIDLYLDKIDGQIIRLTSQSRCGSITFRSSDLSAQREKMLHSLDLVNRLTKTMIGDNDAVASSNEIDINETTVTEDSSDTGSSGSESDDNTSNYSGTDTETADEGDFSDDLLDV